MKTEQDIAQILDRFDLRIRTKVGPHGSGICIDLLVKGQDQVRATLGRDLGSDLEHCRCDLLPDRIRDALVTVLDAVPSIRS